MAPARPTGILGALVRAARPARRPSGLGLGVWGMPRGEVKVCSLGDALLYESDVARLQGTGWLNDACIAFGMEYMERRSAGTAPERRPILVGPSAAFMATQMSGEEWGAVCGAPLGIDAGTRRRVVLPVSNSVTPDAHESGSHWSVLVLSPTGAGAAGRQLAAWHVDSMGGCNWGPASRLAREVARAMGARLASVSPVPGAPQQANQSDCGVFALECARAAVLLEREGGGWGAGDLGRALARRCEELGGARGLGERARELWEGRARAVAAAGSLAFPDPDWGAPQGLA